MSLDALDLNQSPFTALVVEPDDEIGGAAAAALATAGFNVLRSDSFHQGRELLVSHMPKVLVAAVRLGAFNGLHLALRARQAARMPAVIITSGVADPVLQRDAEQLGATFALLPLSPMELLAAVYRTAARSSPAEVIRPPFERRHAERRTAAVALPVERRQHERRRDVAGLPDRAFS